MTAPLTPETPSPRIALLSLGCAKNLVDSEGLVGQLLAAGFELVERIEEADLALVNTCGFIEPAKQESIDTILKVSKHKEFGRLRGVLVAGCLVERYIDDLEGSIPEVDRWLRFGDYGAIVEAAQEVMGLERVRPLPAERILLTASPYAYLKISEGCDQKCTFCAIPGIRGKLVSRTIEANVEDARRIAGLGVQEINVVSQDTTAYGRDLYGKPRLVELLEALTAIEGPSWWRLLYLYPSILRDDLLDAIASNEKIVNYIDVPLQHMSTDVLRRMRRGTTGERQHALLERVRARIPEVGIRTTLIAGFPGETDADHRANLEAVEGGCFDRLGVFTFSREEGTPSFDLADQVDAELAEARRGALMEAQQAVHFARSEARIGQIVDTLVLEVDPFTGLARGRTPWDAPDVDGEVLVPDGRALEVGRIHPIRITGVKDYDLEGKPER